MLCYSSCINHCMLYNVQDNASRTTNYHSYKSKLKTLEATDEDYGMKRRRYLSEEIAWTGNEFQKITCGNPDLDTDRISVTLPLFNYSVSSEPYKILNAEDCGKRCIVTAPRKEMCTNKKTVIEYNIGVTFWMYFAIRVFIGILRLYCIYKYCIFYCFLSNCLTFFFLFIKRRTTSRNLFAGVIGGTTFAMFEGAVIAILREQKADYGLQRIYGSIGGMISSPLSGLLIDYASTGKEYTDFR